MVHLKYIKSQTFQQRKQHSVVFRNVICVLWNSGKFDLILAGLKKRFWLVKEKKV